VSASLMVGLWSRWLLGVRQPMPQLLVGTAAGWRVWATVRGGDSSRPARQVGNRPTRKSGSSRPEPKGPGNLCRARPRARSVTCGRMWPMPWWKAMA